MVERLRQRFPGVCVIIGSERLRDADSAFSPGPAFSSSASAESRVLQIELPCAPVELAQLLERAAWPSAATIGLRSSVELSTVLASAPLEWTSAMGDASSTSSRWTLERVLQDLLHDAKHNAGTHTACVIAVDRCRLLLDPLGAAARESALRQVRERIRKAVPAGSCVGVLGDGAIGISMPRTSMREANRVAELAIAEIGAHPYRVGTSSTRLTGSAGLAPILASHATALEALRSASIALDVAAASAGNRVCEFREDDPEFSNRRSLEESLPEIEAALAEERFQLYAQLIVPTQPADTVNAEILLRMVGRDGAVKSPAAFVAAAERYGIIGRLDRWVFEHTLTLLRGWAAASMPLGHLAVNLSGLTLSDPAALAWIEERVSEARPSAGRLCIEITETAALGQSTAVAAFIIRLQQQGVCFSLDDFGAGFSSFTYLESVPAETLKIDGSLVRCVSGNTRREQLLRTVNDVGHLFGKHTVAEFVEDEEAMELVTRLGIDFAQGHFIGRPFPAENLPSEIERWLMRDRHRERSSDTNN